MTPVAPRPTAVPGVALLPAGFEELVTDLRRSIDALADDEDGDIVALTATPVIPRATIERAGYVADFPNMIGTVHTFQGNEKEWLKLRPLARSGGDWLTEQRPTDVVLSPAACYHVYPTIADSRIDGPRRFRVECYCYRHEATHEVGRLRSFRMREFVYVDTPDACLAWRDRWRERVAQWLSGLGLDVRTEVASDPFFGRIAKLMKQSQTEQNLKLELTAPVTDDSRVAVASANCHKDHLGQAFAITTADGAVAHTACMAFGLERIALALIQAGKA
jgi:seryl-tRNA synthetase